MSPRKIEGRHELDANGNPAGGRTAGVGIEIHWQDGPLGRGADRAEPNGAFVEGVIAAALDRLHFYQTASDGRFACRENALHGLSRTISSATRSPGGSATCASVRRRHSSSAASITAVSRSAGTVTRAANAA